MLAILLLLAGYLVSASLIGKWLEHRRRADTYPDIEFTLDHAGRPRK